MQDVIKVQNIAKSFGDHEVLSDISFAVRAGEKVSLLGPGGSGKSTILKIVLGIVSPDHGGVRLRDLDMLEASTDERQLNLRRVGMAFQQGALFDYMTVSENLKFAMEHMTDFDARQMDEKVEFLLNGVKLGKTKAMFPFELSCVMHRRLVISLALFCFDVLCIFV